jgi:lipid-A-disaccharide synthase
MRYYIIAGEASGDLHASNLIKGLRRHDPEGVFRGWGGDLMELQGTVLVKHYRDLAFMGFFEVLTHLATIMRNFRLCEADLLEYKPDVVILVDYPGFNLPMAKFSSDHGIRVFYYISPQLWAWRSSRVKKIKRYVERLFVILPFEKDFYLRYDYPADFVGHPLMDVIYEGMALKDPQEFRKEHHLNEKRIIALLPGSRKMEIRKMLEVMLSVAPLFPDYQFVIAGAPSIPENEYLNIAGAGKESLVFGQTYDLLRCSTAALVTSGTATLETALLGVPQIVCYKANPFSFMIARKIVHVKFISLVNLIADKPVVKELIQDDLNTGNLRDELTKILEDDRFRSRIRNDYRDLVEKLGGPGASDRVASLMVQYLMKK